MDRDLRRSSISINLSTTQTRNLPNRSSRNERDTGASGKSAVQDLSALLGPTVGVGGYARFVA